MPVRVKPSVLAVPLAAGIVASPGSEIYDDRQNKKCSACRKCFIMGDERIQIADKSFCHVACTDIVDGIICIKTALSDLTTAPIALSIFLYWPEIRSLEQEQQNFFNEQPVNPIYTHLMAHCELGNIDIVTWLVQIKGNDVTEANTEGFTPLMATCEGARKFYNVDTIGRYVDIFKFLLAHGADIRAYTRDEGWTAHMSAKNVREMHELFRSDEIYDKYFKHVYLKEDCVQTETQVNGVPGCLPVSKLLSPAALATRSASF